LVARAIIRKYPDAFTLLLGVLVVTGGVVYAIFEHTSGGSAPVPFVYLCLSFFVLTQAVVIGRQAARATETAKRLREELIEANTRLEHRVAERTRELAVSVSKAEAANQAKTDFLSMMSHELRTPMNAVLGSAQSLKMFHLPKKAEELVDTLSDAGRILMTLLNDILDLAKIEAGKLDIENADMDVSQILGSVERLFRAQADDKDLDFSLKIDEEVPNWVHADPTRIRQIMFNLVSNALKFTQQGSVKIHASAEPQKNGKVKLSVAVSDTGIGIPEAARSRLFGRFQQAETSTSRRFGGTGLGLAISRQLTELMGGHLTLQSVEGEGSTFTIQIEVGVCENQNRPRASESKKAKPAVLARKLKILAAEDNQMNRRVLTAFLSSFGQEAVYADHGAHALEILAGQHFDLVLMDIQMPVMDGVSAVEKLRANQDGPNANVPVIAMTANTMAGDHESYLAAGMDDFVCKPMDIRALYTAINRAISGKPRARKQVETVEKQA
jgi:signal transduction histidine kinase/AmiR/NasT family two-component response regulator